MWVILVLHIFSELQEFSLGNLGQTSCPLHAHGPCLCEGPILVVAAGLPSLYFHVLWKGFLFPLVLWHLSHLSPGMPIACCWLQRDSFLCFLSRRTVPVKLMFGGGFPSKVNQMISSLYLSTALDKAPFACVDTTVFSREQRLPSYALPNSTASWKGLPCALSAQGEGVEPSC